MGLYPLDENYGPSTWYENQGAYDLWTGTDLLLDLSRHILDSDAYLFQGIAFPKGNDIYVPYQQTFSGTINLAPFSYVVSMSAWTGNSNQFTCRIFDKGAQTDLYFRQFAWYPTVVSNMTGEPNMGQTIRQRDRDKPFGPYFLRDPLIILPPGVLQVQVTNVARLDPTAPGIVQMLFGVAVPRNTITMQNRRIMTSKDQTGVETMQGVNDVTVLI